MTISDGVIAVVLTVAIVVAIMGLLVLLFFSFNKASCSQYADQTGHTTEYRFPSGCYVETPKGWLPINQGGI